MTFRLLFGLLLASGTVHGDAQGPMRLPVEHFVALPLDVRDPECLAVDPATGEFHVGTFDMREPDNGGSDALLRFARDGRRLARRSRGPTPLTGVAFATGHGCVFDFSASRLQHLPSRLAADTPVEDVAAFAALARAQPSRAMPQSRRQP